MKSITLDDMLKQSVAIRQAYHQLKEKHHELRWTIEEDLLAL